MERGNHGLLIAIRLLKLRDFIVANASKTQCVTRSDMENYLKEQDFPVDKKTLYRDLYALQDYFGLYLNYDEHKKGYFLDNPPFEPYELRLMIDSVQSSKFITQEESRKITAKIKSMSGRRVQESLNRTSYVADRVRSKNDSVVRDTDNIHEAIAANRKIGFRYFHYSPDARKPKSYSKSGEQVVVSPFALYWNNGNLYLYAYDGKKFRFYRVDRMENISKPRPEQREGHAGFKESSLTRQEAKVFDMYSTGKVYKVKLRCHNRIAHAVIDQFGKDIMMIPVDSEHFSVLCPVEISPPFFAWVATFGHSMKITEPAPVVEEMQRFIEKVSDMYKDDGNT